MKLKTLAIGVSAIVMALALPLTALASFYPADRPTFTCNGNACEGADYVTFNSFTNNPVVGDERPFFSGSLGGANVQDRIKVKNGDEITLRAYVHNNADPNKMDKAATIARNVKIKVIVPNEKRQDQNLVAFISASNAKPGTINDTMSLYGDAPFNLEYVAGSAQFARKDDGVNMKTDKLNDSIVADGEYLGDMYGCFQYSGYVTLKVKVKMDEKPVPPTPEPKPEPTPENPKTPEAPAPAGQAPATIAATGPEAMVSGVAGASALGYGVRRWLMSKAALKDALNQ